MRIGRDVTGDVTVTWTESDVTGSDVTSCMTSQVTSPMTSFMTSLDAIFSRVFWIFWEFSGMFVNVRDVFGAMVRGRSPRMRGGFLRMRERKRAFFSRAFSDFRCFSSYGMGVWTRSRVFWRWGVAVVSGMDFCACASGSEHCSSSFSRDITLFSRAFSDFDVFCLIIFGI